MTISTQEDVFLPFQLAQMSRDSGVPFRISVFLNTPNLEGQVQEMAKAFVQINNPLLRRLRVARIESFRRDAQPDSEVNLVLANRTEDLQQISVLPPIVVINKVPATNSPTSNKYASLLMPFQQIADIEIADCAEKEGVEHEDIASMACFTVGDNLIISAMNPIKGRTKYFQKSDTLLIKPLNTLPFDAIPPRLSGLVFVADYLRSWRQNISSTILRRETNGTLHVAPITVCKGEITFTEIANGTHRIPIVAAS
jgi:hypothetical protein